LHTKAKNLVPIVGKQQLLVLCKSKTELHVLKIHSEILHVGLDNPKYFENDVETIKLELKHSSPFSATMPS
jgi:hypothetical protein